MSRNDFKLIAYVSNVWCPIIISPTILSYYCKVQGKQYSE